MHSLIKLAKEASILFVFVLIGCSQQKQATTKTFYDIDSLVTKQIAALKGDQLSKSAEINGKSEQITFAPDSLQWARELESFRQLDQINKASFRDAYVVTDTRDTNSNLMVRELKSNRLVPVSSVKLYYLGTPNNLKRIEGTWTEENSLYVNERHVTMELGVSYRIEGSQKMIMSDNVDFVITGEIVH